LIKKSDEPKVLAAPVVPSKVKVIICSALPIILRDDFFISREWVTVAMKGSGEDIKTSRAFSTALPTPVHDLNN